MNPSFKLTLLAAAVAVSGCSTLDTEKVNYRGTTKAPSLVVPPDLTQLSRDTRYAIVDGGVSALGNPAAARAASQSKTEVAPNVLGDVRIERLGNQRWLVVKRSPEAVWDTTKEFWKENGLPLAMDQKSTGIMETEWVENRAKIPQDFIRATLGKVFDSLYSAGQRDKYRARMERAPNGETEIYISHRGVAEVYSTTDKTGTAWQLRPSDPELEIEFLRRLMVKLGGTPEQAAAAVAAAPATSSKSVATVVTVGGNSTLRIEEGFDRAWRRVGLALDRTGFTVEDRDRKQGIYFVRYVTGDGENKEAGFFSKLFGSADKANAASKYQIAVRSQGDVTVVSVVDAQGKPDLSPGGQRIMKIVADDIK